MGKAINALGAEIPVFTPLAIEARKEVDELFAASDRVTNSIFHAIHAKAIKGEPWVKDESTGMYHQPPEAETAAEEAGVTDVVAGVLAVGQLAELDESLIPADLVDADAINA